MRSFTLEQSSLALAAEVYYSDAARYVSVDSRCAYACSPMLIELYGGDIANLFKSTKTAVELLKSIERFPKKQQAFIAAQGYAVE